MDILNVKMTITASHRQAEMTANTVGWC